MTDSELRDKVLQHFYRKRFEGLATIRCTDIALDLGAIEFNRICKDMKDRGLIEWNPRGGSMTSPDGNGCITAKGVDEIERKSQTLNQPVSHMPRGQSGSSIRGKPTITPNRAVELLSEQIEKARELVRLPMIHGGDYANWDNTATNMVEWAFGENHPNIEYFSVQEPPTTYRTWSADRWSNHYKETLHLKIPALLGYIDQLKAMGSPEESTRKEPMSANEVSKKIFIVHGHDSDAREQLELILHRLDLDPFILQNTGGGGLTIIEALEKEIGTRAGAAGFGIVLLTPDDMGYAISEEATSAKPRARQNVILEMGMLIATVGRPNVVILKKGDVDIPSDAHGIIYVPFAKHVKETVPKLVHRLQAAGFALSPAAIAEASS